MPMTAKKPKGRIKTELGLEIQTTQSHAMAEYIARLREEVDDHQEKVSRRLTELLDQMKKDDLPVIAVKAPGGTLYRFDIEDRGQRVKVSKPQQG